MLRFDYCPPFEVYAGAASPVKPLLETHSLKSALECLRTRDNTSLTVRILITDGNASTLVPVAVSSSDLEGRSSDELTAFIEASAEKRFKSLVHGVATTATSV